MVNKDLLKKMIEVASPSGREDGLIHLVENEYKDNVDTFIYDHQGSLTSVYNKDASFKIQLMAHADEISLIVNGYNSDGSLSVASNGGIRPILYVGSKVRVITTKGIVNGVIGTNSRLTKGEKVDASDLFLDIGASNAKEAKEAILLGSYVIHDTDLVDLLDDKVSARAFDDRLGVFIIQEAARKAKELGSKIGIYATCTTGEENTGRGAYSSAKMVKPNATIVVDVTFSTDYSGSDTPGEVLLGKGGVICLGSIPNRKLNALLEESAKKVNCSVQYEVWPGRTATDGDTVLKANNGEPIVLFSIPLRYMHSPVEVASYKDIESMIDVLASFLCFINQDVNLNPYQD